MELKFNVLKILYERQGYTSGIELASILGVSRTAIWKSVNSLRTMGYAIEAASRRGYRLVKTPDLLLPYEIKRGLRARSFGGRIEYYQEVGSTNDVARELAIQGTPEGTVVVAETQSMGRGRMGREWFSPKGGIWLSVVLRPRVSPDKVSKLALMFGVVATKTLLLEGVECGLKWPNDVLVDDKKVCGILTEIDAELDVVNYVIIGVGINVNNDPMEFPPEFRDAATTLKAELGREVPRAPIVRRFLEELERAYRLFSSGESSTMLEEWRSLSGTLGRNVRIVTHSRTFEGTATNIDDDGALLLRLKDEKLERVLSGDCIHLEEKI